VLTDNFEASIAGRGRGGQMPAQAQCKGVSKVRSKVVHQTLDVKTEADCYHICQGQFCADRGGGCIVVWWRLSKGYLCLTIFFFSVPYDAMGRLILSVTRARSSPGCSGFRAEVINVCVGGVGLYPLAIATVALGTPLVGTIVHELGIFKILGGWN
jgi:hypothetical protein